MKILQIIAGAAYGGAETAFVDLVSALHQRGINQRVIMRPHLHHTQRLHAAGITPLTAPFRKWFDFKTRRLIAQTIREYEPTIIQTWMDRATHAMPHGPFPSSVHVGWLGGYYRLRYYRSCDHLIGVAPDLVDYIQRESGFPSSRIHLMRTFSTEEIAEPLDRRLFNTPEKAPLLLSLARFHPEKALDILLKALVKVPTAYLWMAGDGEQHEELVALAAHLKVADRVRFLGWRLDRAALLKTANICVFPSRIEPFGTVMVEAWAYKIPLIAAAAIGPRTHIKDGINGLLVPIDDSEALAQAIQRLIKDTELAASLIAAGYETYQTTFTEKVVAEHYIQFYKSLSSETAQ